MKLFLIIFLFTASPLYCVSPYDEIELIQELVGTTKKNLIEQEKLLKILKDFQEARSAFISNPSSGKLAAKLVRVSANLKNKVEEEHLEHLFSTDLLTEVQFFTKVGQMQNISHE